MPDNGLTLYAKWTESPRPTAISGGASENNSSSSTKLAETGSDVSMLLFATAGFIVTGFILIKLIKTNLICWL